MKRIIFVVMLCVFSNVGYAIDEKAAEIYFDKSIHSYLNGKTEEAIKNAEQGLKLNPQNWSIKDFLIKLLIERGNELYKNKVYSEALPYFERAKAIAPNNKNVKKMYTIIYNKLHPESVVPGSQPSLGFTKELLNSVKSQQRKFLQSFLLPKQLITEMVSRFEKQRQEFFKILSVRDRMFGSALQKELRLFSTKFYILIIGGAFGIGLMFLLVYLLLSRSIIQRERFLLKQQERILNMFHEENVVLIQGTKKLLLASSEMREGKVSSKDMLNDSNPRVRAKGVEIIEAELIEQKDSELAERILKPFLNDPDNRVRANAVKAIYRYNPEVAMLRLKEMFESQDKWMKVSAAWVAGEIITDETTQFLLKYKDTDDTHLRNRVIKSLIKIKENKGISSTLQKEVSRFLSKVEG